MVDLECAVCSRGVYDGLLCQTCNEWFGIYVDWVRVLMQYEQTRRHLLEQDELHNAITEDAFIVVDGLWDEDPHILTRLYEERQLHTYGLNDNHDASASCVEVSVFTMDKMWAMFERQWPGE